MNALGLEPPNYPTLINYILNYWAPYTAIDLILQIFGCKSIAKTH